MQSVSQGKVIEVNTRQLVSPATSVDGDGVGINIAPNRRGKQRGNGAGRKSQHVSHSCEWEMEAYSGTVMHAGFARTAKIVYLGRPLFHRW